MSEANRVCVYIGAELARYSFGHGHPFGPDRMDAFWHEAERQGLDRHVNCCKPVTATQADIERFHTRDYVEWVKAQSEQGDGFLDYGDTPAFPGVYEAASTVVGSVLDAVARIIAGECTRIFIPIAGLHHARRDAAAGFCVFNDCGVAIETLRQVHHIRRVAYVDIDAHHGDGVYYAFDEDPLLFIADLHEDGHYLYPGTGAEYETGKGEATGTKVNIPMPPDAGDEKFMQAWLRVEDFLNEAQPEFILLQCGADSMAGDPITHLRYTEACHAHATVRLCELADRHCGGRLLALGGGGYDRGNLARAWSAVVGAMTNAG